MMMKEEIQSNTYNSAPVSGENTLTPQEQGLNETMPCTLVENHMETCNDNPPGSSLITSQTEALEKFSIAFIDSDFP
jgi:hypothetical protein